MRIVVFPLSLRAEPWPAADSNPSSCGTVRESFPHAFSTKTDARARARRQPCVAIPPVTARHALRFPPIHPPRISGNKAPHLHRFLDAQEGQRRPPAARWPSLPLVGAQTFPYRPAL